VAGFKFDFGEIAKEMAAANPPGLSEVHNQSRMSTYGGMSLSLPRPLVQQQTTGPAPYFQGQSGNRSFPDEHPLPSQLINESRYLPTPLQPDPGHPAVTTGMFYDERDDHINRQANKMNSNFNHIVFNGAATTIDDVELMKVRRYQQAVTYQKSLLEQIEANKMKKELEKENEKRENEIERLKMEQQLHQERQGEEMLKEQDRILKLQRMELAEQEQRNQPILLKSQSHFRKTLQNFEAKSLKSNIKTVTIHPVGLSKDNKDLRETREPNNFEPNLSQSLFQQRREMHKREQQQMEDSRSKQRLDQREREERRELEDRRLSAMLVEVKAEIQNQMASKVSEIANRIDTNSREVKHDLNCFKEATMALEKERSHIVDNLDRFRQEIDQLRAEERVRRQRQLHSLRTQAPYKIINTYGFNYEESESEIEAYRDGLMCIFDADTVNERGVRMKLREIFDESPRSNSDCSFTCEEDLAEAECPPVRFLPNPLRPNWAEDKPSKVNWWE